jgi:hypothetical protein
MQVTIETRIPYALSVMRYVQSFWKPKRAHSLLKSKKAVHREVWELYKVGPDTLVPPKHEVRVLQRMVWSKQ